MHRIISDSWRYLQHEGLRKFVIRLLSEMALRLRRLQQHLLGFFVELRGNIWVLDGLSFSLDDSAIPRRLKSQFVKGTYERAERSLVKKYLPTDLPVIEGGASLGVVSCITNSLLQDPAKHLVVEANPQLISVLESNRDRNNCQFSIVHAALDPNGPEATFYIHDKFLAGSARQVTNKAVTVPAVTIRDLIAKNGWVKISLMCDIEGAEIDLIQHESDVLRDHVAVFIVEMHPKISGQQAVDVALGKLHDIGFVLLERENDVYAYHNSRGAERH